VLDQRYGSSFGLYARPAFYQRAARALLARRQVSVQFPQLGRVV